MADESKTRALARCENVLSLYRHYRGLNLRVRRAEMRGGEVRADELDMVCDVDLAAKRALSQVEYLLFIRLSITNPKMLSEAVRVKLGEAFKHLDETGDYRELFWRAVQGRRKAGSEDELRSADGEESSRPAVSHTFSENISDEEVSAVFSATEPSFFAN
jgi:hypothetical protein